MELTQEIDDCAKTIYEKVQEASEADIRTIKQIMPLTGRLSDGGLLQVHRKHPKAHHLIRSRPRVQARAEEGSVQGSVQSQNPDPDQRTQGHNREVHVEDKPPPAGGARFAQHPKVTNVGAARVPHLQRRLHREAAQRRKGPHQPNPQHMLLLPGRQGNRVSKKHLRHQRKPGPANKRRRYVPEGLGDKEQQLHMHQRNPECAPARDIRTQSDPNRLEDERKKCFKR